MYDDMFRPIISRVSAYSFKTDTHTRNKFFGITAVRFSFLAQLIIASLQTNPLKLIKVTSRPLHTISEINLTHLIAKIVFSLFLRVVFIFAYLQLQGFQEQAGASSVGRGVFGAAGLKIPRRRTDSISNETGREQPRSHW